MYDVLIVEDERAIRMGLSIVVDWNALGFRIAAHAENGVEALHMMEKGHYDVALLDIRMPLMNGLEFAREVRARGIQTELIVVSGYQNFEYARDAISYGVRKYLVKPISTTELTGALAEIRQDLDARNGHAPANSDGLVEAVKSYVKAHYTQDISIKGISEALHYNAAYLGRLFTEETGMRFRDYLNMVRAEQAAAQLARGQRRISEVASNVGYSDFNYFRRVFKSIYGVSPAEYRKGRREAAP